MYILRVLIFFVLSFFSLNAFSDGTSIEGDRGEALDLLRSLDANWIALKSFDVHLNSFESCLRPDDVAEQKRTLQRFIVSEDSQSFLYVRRFDLELIGLPAKSWSTYDETVDVRTRRLHKIEGKTEDDPFVRRSFGVYWAFFTNGRLRISENAGSPKLFAIESMTDARKKAECPDFSSIGFVHFPGQNANQFSAEELVLPAETVSVRTTSDTTTISISKPSGAKSRYHQWWQLDLERFAVQKYERLWGPLDITSSEKPIKLLSQRIEWDEVSGVFIPTMVIGTSMGALPDEQGKQFSYEKLDECEFVWKQVNLVKKIDVDVAKLTQGEFILDFLKED